MEAKRPRLLNKPNFITSFRVLLFCTSFLYYKTKPLYFLGFYVSSVVLDMVDGEVARKYGESTIFGAMFDSLFDRMTTAFVYMHLAMKYPKYFLFFYFVLVWDVVGHWAHNYVCCLLGNTNHKKIDGFFLLKMYYEKRPLMGTSIVCFETFFLSLYYLTFTKPGTNLHNFVRFLLYGSLPLAAFKAFTNTAQFFYASKRLSNYEVEQFDLKAGAR
ncbi:CDP-alcohol phosphatidyltransferase family protein [Theileria parva strain Muguga]|uniref:CDP-diacylglycerol--inositol 3-phosphatidyltransferase n=1 Tax=Theileria parva TaxID=5875 RepID=Q4N408_THEPA|nr:CDP-alcohol phosphatidyltransferase family protein [Theileria parva strain Muguga]EAN33115.1 CDP-alcohol phosphatidyltransferase family protein [Theileria parva strain Muguga]|eukprot:XP_765398.1 phosphatidylinositol synthase [Theileria parva strain Muguga]